MMQAPAPQRLHAHFWVSDLLGAYLSSKCWNVILVWPAAPKSVCILHKQLLVARGFSVFVIQLLEFPLGVSCGAKKCLYCTPKVTLSHYC